MKIAQISAPTVKNSTQPADTGKEREMRKACGDFEAIILRQMLATMRESIPKSGLLDGGYSEKMYQSMQDAEMADQMAHGRGTGFGEMLYRQLSGQSKSTIISK